MSASPIEQFTIKTIGSDIMIGGLNISFSNSALLMTLTTLLIFAFFYITLRKSSVIPSKLQAISESSYDFIEGMAKENLGSKAKKFVPLLYTIFLFFLFGNLLGLIPFSFAFTAQLVIPMVVALFILILATIYGIYLHGFKFIKVLIPSGVPLALLPFMIVLEFISYISKSLSMAVRIFANIMAGHIVLEIFAGFVVALGIFGILPFSIMVVLYGFELVVACLQAYIFTILSCIFIQQVIDLH